MCGMRRRCADRGRQPDPSRLSIQQHHVPGQVERVGIFTNTAGCAATAFWAPPGGICPITKCAKSLVNGPCGGQKNGKCEANPENDCAWIQIYNRLVAIGQEDKLLNARTDKGYANAVYPKHVNLRGKKV